MVSALPDESRRPAVQRAQRFACLRKAQRALQAPMEGSDPLATARKAREARSLLKRFDAGQGGPDALSRVDFLLDDIELAILESLDRIPFGQLRAVLPRRAENNRDEVAALLDLCIQKLQDRESRLRISEYLITLLASQPTPAGRVVIGDPAFVTRTVAQTCRMARVPTGLDFEPYEAAERFAEAASDLQLVDDLGSVVERMRTLKLRLGPGILLPDVLRELVNYNVAVWNRTSDMLDEERTSDFMTQAGVLEAAEARRVPLTDDDKDAEPERTTLSMERDVIRERVRRFATLRAAQRALAPAARQPGRLPSDSLARDLSERLSALRAGTDGSGEGLAGDPEEWSALSEIDALLDEVSSRLLRALDEIPFPELRAAMPDMAIGHREEVVALLELCIAGGLREQRRIRVAEYLVTLLSSQEREGIRVPAGDPYEISPALKLEARREIDTDLCLEDAARQLAAAAVELSEKRDISYLADRIRELKARLGRNLFRPEVLPHVLAYNLGAWRRNLELLEEERSLDARSAAEAFSAALQAGGAFASSERDADADPEAGAELGPRDPEAERQAGLAHTAARTDELRDAVRRRLVGDEIAGRPLADDVGLDDTEFERIGERERAAFRSDDPTTDALVCRIVCTGILLDRDLRGSSSSGPTAATTDVLRGEWLRGLHQETRELIRQLVSEGRCSRARELSELKDRHLCKHLEPLLQQQRRQGSNVFPRTAAAGRTADQTPAPAPVPASTRSRSYTGVVSTLLIVLCVASVVALVRIAVLEPRPVEVYDASRLAAASPWIASGFRPTEPDPGLFIGTVVGVWDRLDVEEQRAQGLAIADHLSADGVEDVMLYDASRRLRFHSVRGQVHVLATAD